MSLTDYFLQRGTLKFDVLTLFTIKTNFEKYN